MNKKIAIIDKNNHDSEMVDEILRKKESFDVINLSQEEDITQLVGKKIAIFIVEVSLPNKLGLHKIRKIKQLYPKAKFIVVSSFSNESLAIDCLREGVSDFIKKPIDFTYLTYSINKVFEELAKRPLKVVKNEKNDTNNKENNFNNTFPISKKMNQVMDTIEKVSSQDVSCLLTGESGSGKEYFARMIHQLGDRSSMPFIAVNCPAIPETLFESELFGHEKGSFTGADRTKLGKIELANGGILFLDEIGDLSPEAQSKLLRVLQEREIERVGGTKKIPVDIMLITATSKNIRMQIREEIFRPDLYYRIADIEVEIPPLVDRKDDIPQLSVQFLQDLGNEMNRPIKSVDQKVLQLLKDYHWPGNIRELKSLVRKLHILVPEETLTIANSRDEILKHFENSVEYPKKVDPIEYFHQKSNPMDIKSSEKQLIHQALGQANGNLTKAAKIIGLSRSTLYRKMKKYEIKNSA